MRDLTNTSNAPDSASEPPDFDTWDDPEELFQGQSTKERLMDVVIQLREPTKVSVVAEQADCDPETARHYLDWFTDLGLVHKHSGRPTRYERNDSYLRWRRVEKIRERYSEEEIVEELRDVMDGIREFQDQFGAAAPGEVSLKEASRDSTIEESWDALSKWKTLERRAELLDEARRDSFPSGGVDRINA